MKTRRFPRSPIKLERHETNATVHFEFRVPVTVEELREVHPDATIVGFIVRGVDGQLMVVADDGE